MTNIVKITLKGIFRDRVFQGIMVTACAFLLIPGIASLSMRQVTELSLTLSLSLISFIMLLLSVFLGGHLALEGYRAALHQLGAWATLDSGPIPHGEICRNGFLYFVCGPCPWCCCLPGCFLDQHYLSSRPAGCLGELCALHIFRSDEIYPGDCSGVFVFLGKYLLFSASVWYHCNLSRRKCYAAGIRIPSLRGWNETLSAHPSVCGGAILYSPKFQRL